MQTKNVKPDITVTVRHENVTDSLRQYAEDKINGIHLDYPRIIGAKAILDVEGSRRHKAEIILFCANHIVIDASFVRPICPCWDPVSQYVQGLPQPQDGFSSAIANVVRDLCSWSRSERRAELEAHLEIGPT